MLKETKTVIYDRELNLEAYRFTGTRQPFPNHFHEHYVIGLVEEGQRKLSCKNREYVIEKGSIVLFNPGDNHACVQSGGDAFDYRGINISRRVMSDLAREVSGTWELPGFSQNVVCDEEVSCYLRRLHEMVMGGSDGFGKEETLLLLISRLIQNYGQTFESCVPECSREIEKACEYMEGHFAEHICLDQICRYTGLSKSTLLRAFTKTKGITPYRYLETIRIGEAKKLLAEGITPAETAARTGFSDQSHFTNYFSQFIGLAPGIYREIFSGKGRAAGSMENERGMSRTDYQNGRAGNGFTE